MRKFFLLLMFGIVLSSAAQKPQTRASSRPKTQKTQSSQKPKTSQKTQSSQKSKPSQKSQKSQKTQKKPTQKQQLQAQQQQLKKNIAANKRQKAELEQKVKKQLEEAFILGTEIDEQKRVIDTIRVSLDSLEQQIVHLNAEKKKLEGELRDRQARYASSVRYMHRNRKMQSRMMFVLSAKNINQMYRRTRFMNEYSTYQRAQGEAVKQKQAQVDQKQQEITQVRDARKAMLAREEKERQTLQKQQDQKQQMAKELQKQQRTVTALIDQQQKEEAKINAEIDRIIAEEIAREQARLEAERKRKAEEQARLERERQERERLAREREKEQKKQDKQKKKQEKAIEKQVRKETKEMARSSSSRRESSSSNSASSEPRRVSSSSNSYIAADPDARLTGSFASNKGRLPMPITGSYQLVRGFGENVVDGTRGVRLSSKGIYLKGKPGAQARCVFDGEVSKIFNTGNSYVVMVRHGRFISVYSDIASVSVRAGQRVSTSQILGNLGPTSIMQFQLRNWTELLNPRLWLRR
ncbi:MAG: peptidoglycan DD-metalloendopeptidase family protein [Prevotella sp.]|nr:peptidoglycan DD-metalloendopeptidase family protein [Prevotella sp.]